jgi:uncharacterized membrane protein YkvA (DUF1232 family)
MKKKQPLTFQHATLRAAAYLARKKNVLKLLNLAARKAEQHYDSLLVSWESLQIFLRMIRAWIAGKYCAPADTILVMVAALIYFLSPFDMIPDSLPVFGMMDDAAVIGFVAKANLTAISNFRKWEILFSGAFPFPGR